MLCLLAFISLLSFGTPSHPIGVSVRQVIIANGSKSVSWCSYNYTNKAWATSGFTNLSSALVTSNYYGPNGSCMVVSYPSISSNTTIVGYAPNTLPNDLTANISSLALNTNQTWSYNPNTSNLGSNTAVWTWPVNLSCVGYASDGYQSVLITPNELLACGHYGGEFGQTVTFHDTNGIAWIAVVTNTVNPIADMIIAQLSNSAPSSIVIPYVLPPNYTNYIYNHTLVGLTAIWLRKNSSSIDYENINSVADNNSYGYGTWMTVYHNNIGTFGNGTSASGGDSGSPAFMIWTNNVPILLFATTTPGDATGMFISGATNWYSLAHSSVGTNGLKIIDLSTYPTY